MEGHPRAVDWWVFSCNADVSVAAESREPGAWRASTVMHWGDRAVFGSAACVAAPDSGEGPRLARQFVNVYRAPALAAKNRALSFVS